MPIEVKQAPDAVHDHHEAFHDMRQSGATKRLAWRGSNAQCLKRREAWDCLLRPVSKHGERRNAAPEAAALLGKSWGSEEVEWVQWDRTGILAGDLGNLSAQEGISPVPADSSLRELCHDLIEPAATIRWLVRAAEAESGEELRERLAAIAAAAGQIAAICDDILDPPQCCPCVRLDEVASEAVASARVRYAGVIDVVAQPVAALVRTGDIIRILYNILANACRAAGPAGRITVEVCEADGQARLTIADSGQGLAGAAAGGRAGLGLEIIGALALKYGGGVHLGFSDLGGLAVTVQVPAQRRSFN